MMTRILYTLIFPVVFLSSCFIGHKAPAGTTLKIINNAAVSNRVPFDSPYWQGKSEEQCVRAFLGGISKELGFYNVTVITEGTADYELNISRLELSETLSNETVNDPKSPYNGKTFQLADITVSASGDISNTKNKAHKTVNGLGSKQEKLSNNRNLGDLIFGSNKDNSTYRLKSLSDDVIINMSEKCGMRVADAVTRKLRKLK